MASPTSPFHHIGTITVPAGEVRKQYETAAWWTRFVYEAQTVDVFSNGYYCKWTVQGSNVEHYTPSLFGGVAIKSDRQWPQEVSEPSTYTFMPYHYTVAEQVAAGGSPITLVGDVSVETLTMDHPVMCRGFTRDADQGKYVPCEHDHHVDRSNDPKGRCMDHRDLSARNDRGFLPTAYAPDTFDTKVHYFFTINGERL